MKKCKICKEPKEIDEFYKNDLNRCKPCVKKRSRQWKMDNAQRKKEMDADYYKRNKEKLKAYSVRYGKENPEIKKAYRRSNKEKLKKVISNYCKTDKYKESEYYAKTVLKKTGFKNPSKEMVQCKVEMLKINRLIKQKYD